jgi:uncharacterized protein (TIGR02466 family)
MIYDLFKISVYKNELLLDNSSLKNLALNTKKNNKGRVISNRGGFQSENLLSENVIRPLINSIEHHANIFVKDLGYDNVQILNIWCNVNEYKDFNIIYGHSQSTLSGVYYVNTPKNCGNIIFHSPHFQLLEMAGQSTKNNNYTSSTWWLPADVGMLYIFPSWLLHHVEPNMNNKEERISYSFNLA